MKILCIIDRLCTPGGAERQLVTLARALTARGHDCTIAALFRGSDLAKDLPEGGIRFQELGAGFQRDFAGAAARVARLVRRGGYDVVQAHLLTSCIASGLSRMLAAGPPRVVVLHNLDYEIYPARNLRQKALRRLHGIALRRLTDGVVAVSESVARHYRSEMAIRRITVIPNSIELGGPAETFLAGREELRRKLGIGEQTALLAYSARMVKQKGHVLLLRALEVLRSRGIAPKLLLVGSGPLEPEIRSAVRNAGLESQVILTGNLAYADALRHIAAADLFVSPSSLEGFGLAIAEAMALGVAVVAVAVGSVPEVVEDGISGLLAPPGSPELLADAVARALADGDLRQRLRRGGVERVQTHFTPAAVAERWEAYFGELLNARDRRTLKAKAAPAPTEMGSNG
ncbi:MAG TPA: glycosyltransferase family 4 protein [Terriglobia bacterium]|nr:glycosyltransferase family 4 protein [Terriglobia bacterium]